MAIDKGMASTADWELLLGEQVRRARLLLDLDQKTLANNANVGLSALKNLEGGKGSTLKTLIRVSRALGKQDWLQDFEPEPEIGPLDIWRLQQERREPTRASNRKLRTTPPVEESAEGND